MKRYSKSYLLLALLGVLIGLSSCKKPKEASEIPFIEYKETTFVSSDSLVLTFHFIDGNGDIGLLPNDTVAPYNVEYMEGDPLYIHKYFVPNTPTIVSDSINRNAYNLILRYEELVDGEWTIPELSPFLLFRINDISPDGQDPYLEGDINVGLNYPSLISSLSNDSVRYFLEFQDRALNLSNVIGTGLIVEP